MLIVDDHEQTRELHAWCLRAAGWIVTTAGDGRQALIVAATCEPDVVVMGLHESSLGGLGAARLLKASDVTRDVPIVACVAADWQLDDAEARKAGCDEILPRACAPEALRDLLEDLVAARALLRLP